MDSMRRRVFSKTRISNAGRRGALVQSRASGMMVAALALLAAVALTSLAHAQQETITISGYVANGTAGAGTPQGVSVVLQVVRPGVQPEERSTLSDALGRFAFADVHLEEESSYTLTAVYLGIGYTRVLAPGEGWSDLRLTVHEATSSLEGVALQSNILLVMGAEPVKRTLSFMEIIQVHNGGDRVFIPDVTQGGPMNLFRLPLPAGALELEVQAELPEGQVLQVDRGFALTSPIPPGEHGIAFTYTVPYTDKRLDISRTFLNGSRMFRALVSEKAGNVASGAMADLGNTSLGSTRYRLLELRDVPSGAAVDLVLEGIPQPSMAQQITSIFQRVGWAMAAPLALALALATLLVIGMRRPRTPALETTDATSLDHLSLVRAIAALDDGYQRGELDETSYQEQRRTLKGRLLRVAWQEEIAP